MYAFFSATPDTNQIVSITNSLLAWNGVAQTLTVIVGLAVGIIILKIILKIVSKPNK